MNAEKELNKKIHPNFMNQFEKITPINEPEKPDTALKTVEPINKEPGEQNINLPEREKPAPYLELTDEERAEVIKKIIDDFKTQGHDVENKQIDFPTDKAEIENWVNEFSKHFAANRLTEVALTNSEYAPKLTRELTDRKEYSQLEKVLQHYKGKPMFEYCVQQIESGLSGDALRDVMLMALSEALAKTEEKQEPKTIAEHETDMKKDKKTARPLNEYQRLLKISDQELKTLSGKELLLVGGGFSPIKSELKTNGIECTVTNIDPIAEPNKEIADNAIKGDFFETNLEENKYDEIMALHSLPTYAFTPEQTEDFYKRSISSLKQGGVLRVTPIYKFSDSFTPSMRLSRQPVNNASREFVEKLKGRPDLFSVAEFTIEHKTALGKKTEMPGAKIEIIGDKDKIKEFFE